MTAGHTAIALIPQGDERQALRLRRYLMAAGTSLMVIVLLCAAYLLGGLEWDGFVQGTALILFSVALFYVVLRSGLNLRFRDPSLTMPQLSVVDRDDGVRHVSRGAGARRC